MRFLRTALVAAIVLGGLAVAAPAHASAVNCEAQFVSLRAFDIQEDGQGQDEIFVWMDGVRYPTTGHALPFVQGQLRPGTDFRLDANSIAFLDELTVELTEDDPLANDPLGPLNITCVTFTDTAWHTLPTLKWTVGSDVDYRAVFRIRRL